MAPVQTKYWIFTFNNYPADEPARLLSLPADPESPITYIFFGREIGDSGTPHLQGYFEVKAKLRLTGVKKLFRPYAPHLEPREGTVEENKIYCSKQNPLEEAGEPNVSAQGRRTDLESAIADVNEGSTLRQLWRDHTVVMVKFERGIKRARAMLAPIEDRPVFHGPWLVAPPPMISGH